MGAHVAPLPPFGPPPLALLRPTPICMLVQRANEGGHRREGVPPCLHAQQTSKLGEPGVAPPLPCLCVRVTSKWRLRGSSTPHPLCTCHRGKRTGGRTQTLSGAPLPFGFMQGQNANGRPRRSGTPSPPCLTMGASKPACALDLEEVPHPPLCM